jgi:hypothetical protein
VSFPRRPEFNYIVAGEGAGTLDIQLGELVIYRASILIILERRGLSLGLPDSNYCRYNNNLGFCKVLLDKAWKYAKINQTRYFELKFKPLHRKSFKYQCRD